MATYSIAQAKNTLPRLIDRALAGEDVVITRRGTIIAEIKPRSLDPDRVRRAAGAMAKLRAFRESAPPLAVDAATLVRQMRDEGY